MAVALNLLPRGKLSVTAVKIQVLHAAERDGTPLSAAVWLDVLEVCEERGIDGKRVMELQEALGIDMAAFEPRTPDESSQVWDGVNGVWVNDETEAEDDAALSSRKRKL